MRLRLASTLLFAAIAGCRTELPDAPGAGFDPSFEQGNVAEPPGLSEDAAPPQVVAPGDTLTLRASGVEKLEQNIVVDATGTMHVPGVGPVELSGVTLAVAEARVATALKKRDKFVEVTVSFAEPSGRRATVVGAVEHPGEFALRPTMRLADLVALSGGPRSDKGDAEVVDLADVAGATLVREGKSVPISLGRALAGDPHHNVYVRSGDLVFVPAARGSRISVLGSVQQPRVVPFRRGVRLTEALAMAGGTSEFADEADVRIVRGPLSQPRVYRANYKDLFRGKATDVLLAPGDVVFVTEHWFGSVTHVVQRLTPFIAATALTVAVSKK
jgi:polysaccharide export outer membrane protein